MFKKSFQGRIIFPTVLVLLVLVASLIFYSFGELSHVLLLLFSVLCNYFFGILLAKKSKHRRVCLIIAITINLMLLGTFKYLGFMISSLNSLFNLDLSSPYLWLNLGVNFAMAALPVLHGLIFITVIFKPVEYMLKLRRIDNELP